MRMSAFLQCLTAMAALAFLGSPATAAGQPLVLGSYAYPGIDRSRALLPLARLVEQVTRQTVEIRLYEDPDQLSEEIEAAQVDVAVLNLGA